MPVMKAQSAGAARTSAIVMDLSDLGQQAATIVSDARVQAEKLIGEGKATAQRDAQRIRDEAHQNGQKEGFAAGMEAGEKQGHDAAIAQTAKNLADLIARWSETLDLLQQHMPVHLADARTDLVRLALAIAARVTHQEALRNRNVAQATAEDTLRMVSSARKVVLLVHPDELATLETYMPELLAKARTIESIDLHPDESVTAGGCVLRFGAGQVDARLETQIDRIAAELLAGEG